MPRFSRTDIAWIGVLIAVAFAVRLAWVLYAEADPTDGRFNDSVFYHVVAHHMAEGGGYTNPYTFLPTAAWAPGYIFLLIPIYWTFGAHYELAELANAMLGAISVGLLFVLGMQLLGRTAAVLSAALLALYPAHIFFTSIIYSETAFLPVFLGALIFLVAATRAPPERRSRWMVAFGIAAGAAALTRGVGIWLLGVGVIYFLVETRDWRSTARYAGLSIFAAAVLIAPWTLRNMITLDAPIIITTSAGTNFWQGHHAGASGGNEFPDELIDAYGPMTKPGAEVEANNGAIRRGLRFLFTHPAEEFSLARRKVRELYDDESISIALNQDSPERAFMGPDMESALRGTANWSYFALLALAGLGMLRWTFVRGHALLLPTIVILVWTAGHIALFGQPRYHHPLIPMFCLMAGWAIAAAIEAATARQGLRG